MWGFLWLRKTPRSRDPAARTPEGTTPERLGETQVKGKRKALLSDCLCSCPEGPTANTNKHRIRMAAVTHTPHVTLHSRGSGGAQDPPPPRPPPSVLPKVPPSLGLLLGLIGR